MPMNPSIPTTTSFTTISDIYEIWIRPREYFNVMTTELPRAWLPLPSFGEDKIIEINIDGLTLGEDAIDARIKTLSINNLYIQRVLDISDLLDELFLEIPERIEEERKVVAPLPLPEIRYNEERRVLEYRFDITTFYNSTKPRVDQLLTMLILRGELRLSWEQIGIGRREISVPILETIRAGEGRRGIFYLEEQRQIIATSQGQGQGNQALREFFAERDKLLRQEEERLNEINRIIQMYEERVAKLTARLKELEKVIAYNTEEERREIARRIERLRREYNARIRTINQDILAINEEIRERNKIIKRIEREVNNTRELLQYYLGRIKEEGYGLDVTMSLPSLIAQYKHVRDTPKTLLIKQGILRKEQQQQQSKARLLALLERAISLARYMTSKLGQIGGNIRSINLLEEKKRRLEDLIRSLEEERDRRIEERRKKEEEELALRLERRTRLLDEAMAEIEEAQKREEEAKKRGEEAKGRIAALKNVAIRIVKLAVDAIFRTITKIKRRITFKLRIKKIYYKVELHIDIVYDPQGRRSITNVQYKELPSKKVYEYGAGAFEALPLPETEKMHEIRLVIPFIKNIFDDEGRIIKERKDEMDSIVIRVLDDIITNFLDELGGGSEGEMMRTYGLIQYLTTYSNWYIGIKRVWAMKRFNEKTYMMISSLDRFGVATYSYFTAELHWGIQKTLEGEGEGEEELIYQGYKSITPWSYDQWDSYIEEIEQESIKQTFAAEE
ncbi:MAG: hypothetical protein QXF17_02760 [Ignisphaera sp.]